MSEFISNLIFQVCDKELKRYCLASPLIRTRTRLVWFFEVLNVSSSALAIQDGLSITAFPGMDVYAYFWKGCLEILLVAWPSWEMFSRLDIKTVGRILKSSKKEAF